MIFAAAESRHGLSGFAVHMLMGATIPALLHRIPSELRSEACLGENSTEMGDLLGSPHLLENWLLKWKDDKWFIDYVENLKIVRWLS